MKGVAHKDMHMLDSPLPQRRASWLTPYKRTQRRAGSIFLCGYNTHYIVFMLLHSEVRNQWQFTRCGFESEVDIHK